MGRHVRYSGLCAFPSHSTPVAGSKGGSETGRRLLQPMPEAVAVSPRRRLPRMLVARMLLYGLLMLGCPGGNGARVKVSIEGRGHGSLPRSRPFSAVAVQPLTGLYFGTSKSDEAWLLALNLSEHSGALYHPLGMVALCE